MAKIKRALISVSNKKGLIEFAKALKERGIEILSTGGTAKHLRDAGIFVKDVSEHTGSPEMLDGRVKTLHPKVHGGILYRRDNPKDRGEVSKFGIDDIDMVVVNLYPFEETITKEGCTFADAIENIDIGGPAMLRSASKNFQDVAVIVDPADYDKVIAEMKSHDDSLTHETKLELAKKVFKKTSQYDAAIADYLTKIIDENAAGKGLA